MADYDLSRRVLDELTPEWMDELFRRGSPLIGGANTCEIRSAAYIKAALEAGVFHERDGLVFNELGYQVVENTYLPSPPKSQPPKPERAFWRGAPRRKR